MPAIQWDSDEIKEFLKTHTVEGYRVTAPVFGPSRISKQVILGDGSTYSVVYADTPVPFSKFAKAMGSDGEQMTLAQWEEAFAYGSHSMPTMAYDLREQLDAGKTVSRQDVLFRDLLDRGCMDVDQNVLCYTFNAMDTPIRGIKPGMAVQIMDRDTGEMGWPGRIIGIETHKSLGKVVLLEQFVPVPFMQTPDALLPEMIKKGYFSDQTWVLGYGIIDAFEEKGMDIPPGERRERERDYVLDKPMPLSEIRKFCKANYPDASLCIQQAMIMYILPLVIKEVQFFPFPEGQNPSDVVVDIELLGE